MSLPFHNLHQVKSDHSLTNRRSFDSHAQKYKVEEVQVIMAGVRAELSNPKLHLMTKFRFVYGRKPGAPNADEIHISGLRNIGSHETLDSQVAPDR
jgi:hypothetical protein